MDDYINRQVAIKEAEQMVEEHQYDFVGMLISLPSEDVQPVVRCKDCKFNPNDTWFDCPMAHLPYKEDRWCWKGERKDE